MDSFRPTSTHTSSKPFYTINMFRSSSFREQKTYGPSTIQAPVFPQLYYPPPPSRPPISYQSCPQLQRSKEMRSFAEYYDHYTRREKEHRGRLRGHRRREREVERRTHELHTPRSVYYMGTPETAAVFLGEREARRDRRSQHEGRRKRKEYVERKSIPPAGRGLRRVKNFFRGEGGW